MKVKLIELLEARINICKAIYDESRGIARSYRDFVIFRKFKHNYEIDPKHLKANPKGKVFILIDVHSRSSLGDKTSKEKRGKSISPEIEPELDAQKMNKLDFLTEASFWASLNLRKHDIMMIIISIFAGMGLLQILRIVLSIYGYSPP